jgi:hypothetical protein
MKFLTFLKETTVTTAVAKNTAQSGFEKETKTNKKKKCGCEEDEKNCEKCKKNYGNKGKDK